MAVVLAAIGARRRSRSLREKRVRDDSVGEWGHHSPTYKLGFLRGGNSGAVDVAAMTDVL